LPARGKNRDRPAKAVASEKPRRASKDGGFVPDVLLPSGATRCGADLLIRHSCFRDTDPGSSPDDDRARRSLVPLPADGVAALSEVRASRAERSQSRRS
jgi:hypothetical protein